MIGESFQTERKIVAKINIVECEVCEIKWPADGGNPWGGNPHKGGATVELPSNTLQVFLLLLFQ